MQTRSKIAGAITAVLLGVLAAVALQAQQPTNKPALSQPATTTVRKIIRVIKHKKPVLAPAAQQPAQVYSAPASAPAKVYTQTSPSGESEEREEEEEDD